MNWNHYDHLYNCPKCGKLLSEKRTEDDLHYDNCKIPDAKQNEHKKDCPLHNWSYEVGSGADIPICKCQAKG